jgi:SAM-dependent methyltransferase
MTTLRAHDWRWKPDGGYYPIQTEELERDPRLPNFRMRSDLKIARLFDRYLPRGRTPDVLELGCGASQWLPYLGLRKKCRVTGLDYEASAVELTVANMRGAGAKGTILHRDAFAAHDNDDLVGRFDLVYSMGLLEHFEDVVTCLGVVARYLRAGGLVLTTVPNLQGPNWALQRFADRRVLEMHVIYDVTRLRRRHEEAGFSTLETGYAGFFDGFLTATAPGVPGWRRRLHRALCRASNLAARGWLSITHERIAPEVRWLSPTIYYVGRRRQ